MPIHILNPHTDDAVAVGGLTHKQVSQIWYHFKAENPGILTMIIKIKTESLKYRRMEITFEFVEELNCEHWQCFILTYLICDPPIFTVPYLRSKVTDCNEWDVVGKVNAMGFLMIWKVIHRIYHLFQKSQINKVSKNCGRSLFTLLTALYSAVVTHHVDLIELCCSKKY